MMIRGSRVDLLVQGKEEVPRAALARLGITIEPGACESSESSVKSEASESPRSLLLECLEQTDATGASRNKSPELQAWLRTRVVDGLRNQRIGHRNRALFLIAVLAADKLAAVALVRAGAVDALCEAVRATGREQLSQIERQWVLVALSHLAGAAPGHAQHFVRAHVPSLLVALIRDAQPRAQSSDLAGAGLATAGQEGPLSPIAHSGLQGESGRGDELRPVQAGSCRQQQLVSSGMHGSGQPTPAATGGEMSERASSAASAEEDRAQLGLCYAASAITANLALNAVGARSVVESGLHATLLRLLDARRGTVSLPCVRWLCTRERSAIHNASLGGGAARAVLNLAYAGNDHARALLTAGALPWLERLQAAPCASDKVREIAGRTAAYLVEVSAYSTAALPTYALKHSCALAGSLPAAKAAGGGKMAPVPPAVFASASSSSSSSVAGDVAPGGSTASPCDAQPTPADCDSSAVIPVGGPAGHVTSTALVPVGFPADHSAKAGPARQGRKRRRKGAPFGGRKRPKGGGGGGADGSDGGGAASMCEFDRILARRLRSGRAEYLIKWRDPVDGGASWEPVHHIHDPATVAGFERGAGAAAAYPDWAWSLDARGAGWACLPLDVSSGGQRGESCGSRPPRVLPENWPQNVTYSPFILWHEPVGSTGCGAPVAGGTAPLAEPTETRPAKLGPAGGAEPSPLSEQRPPRRHEHRGAVQAAGGPADAPTCRSAGAAHPDAPSAPAPHVPDRSPSRQPPSQSSPPSADPAHFPALPPTRPGACPPAEQPHSPRGTVYSPTARTGTGAGAGVGASASCGCCGKAGRGAPNRDASSGGASKRDDATSRDASSRGASKRDAASRDVCKQDASQEAFRGTASLYTARLAMSQWRCLAGVAIKPLPPEHPAAPQHGLFASESIPCGALVGNYTGLVKLQQGADSSHYLVEVHDRHTGFQFDLDAEHYGNETRFINDYKGVAEHPNVAFVLYHAQATGELSVGVVTQRALQHGEEILVDYGRQFWRSPGNSPNPSAPGSPMREA